MNTLKKVFHHGSDTSSTTSSHKHRDSLGSGVGSHHNHNLADNSNTTSNAPGSSRSEGTIPFSGHKDTAVTDSRLENDNMSNTAAYDNTTTTTSRTATQAAPITDVLETEVCQETLPARIQENVSNVEKEIVDTQISRDRHVTEYQQVVVPIQQSQVEETQHEQNILPTRNTVETRDIASEHAAKLETQRGLVTNDRVINPTTRTVEDLGSRVTETIHKHVIEEIQPVIQRDILKPKTIHTTVPIHEEIREAPLVRDVRVSAPISMDEAKLRGINLDGAGMVCQREA